MERSADERRSGFWTTAIFYGLALAVLVSILKYTEYHYLIRELRMEVYVGAVAVLFTGLGVWVGSMLLRGKRNEAPVAPQPTPKKEVVRTLGISARELEVLELMAQGCSNQEIADRLFISLPTVKSHSSSLFGKLEVRRRMQAVLKARTVGIIP